MGGMNPLMTYMLTRGNDDRRDEGRIDNRFRDGRGRDHYDNGRFAPMRSEYDGGMQMGHGTSYPTHSGYESPSMGYSEPVRMGGYSMEYILNNILCVLENNVYSVPFGWNIFYNSTKSIWLMCHLKQVFPYYFLLG